jgi:uncharacterized protein involved in exopolysaccharide biosynthesis
MKPSAAEALKAAIRRAIPLTIVLVLMGIVAMNVLKQLQGPRYEADARVALQTVDLGAMLTGVDPGFVDPERQVETALALARSPEVYRRAAARLRGRRGPAPSFATPPPSTGARRATSSISPRPRTRGRKRLRS